MKVIGIGLPRTGTTTLKRALEILGVEHEVGDHVHFMPSWDADLLILTYRKDPDTWYESVRKRTPFLNKILEIQRIRMYGSVDPNPYFKVLYLHHNIMALKFPNVVPMCWEEGDGWEKLCKFVNKPVPDMPFPHLNKS